jgi:hypothetical protein
MIGKMLAETMENDYELANFLYLYVTKEQSFDYLSTIIIYTYVIFLTNWAIVCILDDKDFCFIGIYHMSHEIIGAWSPETEKKIDRAELLETKQPLDALAKTVPLVDEWEVQQEIESIDPVLRDFYISRIADNPTSRNTKRTLDEADASLNQAKPEKGKQRRRYLRAARKEAKSWAAAEFFEIQKMYQLQRVVDKLTTTKILNNKKYTHQEVSEHISKQFIDLRNMLCDQEGKSDQKIRDLMSLQDKLVNGAPKNKRDKGDSMYQAWKHALLFHGHHLDDLMIHGPKTYLSRMYAQENFDKEAMETQKQVMEDKLNALNSQLTAADKEAITTKINTIKSSLEQKTWSLDTKTRSEIQSQIEQSIVANAMVSTIEGAEGVWAGVSKVFTLDTSWIQRFLADAVVVTGWIGQWTGNQSAMGTTATLSIGTTKLIWLGASNEITWDTRWKINYGPYVWVGYQRQTGFFGRGAWVWAGVTLRLSSMRNDTETKNMSQGFFDRNAYLSIWWSWTITPLLPVYTAGITFSTDRFGRHAEKATQLAKILDSTFSDLAGSKDLDTEIASLFPKTRKKDLKSLKRDIQQWIKTYTDVINKTPTITSDQKTDLKNKMITHIVYNRYNRAIEKTTWFDVTGVTAWVAIVAWVPLPFAAPLIAWYRHHHYEADPQSYRQAEQDLRIGRWIEKTGETLSEQIEGLNIRLWIDKADHKIMKRDTQVWWYDMIWFPLKSLESKKVNLYLQWTLQQWPNATTWYQVVEKDDEHYLVIASCHHVYETMTMINRWKITSLYLGWVVPGRIEENLSKVESTASIGSLDVPSMQLYLDEITKDTLERDRIAYATAINTQIKATYTDPTLQVFDTTKNPEVQFGEDGYVQLPLVLWIDTQKIIIWDNLKDRIKIVTIDGIDYLQIPPSGQLELQASTNPAEQGIVRILYQPDEITPTQPQLSFSKNKEVRSFWERIEAARWTPISAEMFDTKLIKYFRSPLASEAFMRLRYLSANKKNPDHDLFYSYLDNYNQENANRAVELLKKYFTDIVDFIWDGSEWTIDFSYPTGEANLRAIYNELSRVAKTEFKAVDNTNANNKLLTLLDQSWLSGVDKNQLTTLWAEIFDDNSGIKFRAKKWEILQILWVTESKIMTLQPGKGNDIFDAKYRIYWMLADAAEVLDSRTNAYRRRMWNETEYKWKTAAIEDLMFMRATSRDSASMKYSLHGSRYDAKVSDGSVGIVAAYEWDGNQMKEKFVIGASIMQDSQISVLSTWMWLIHRKYYRNNILKAHPATIDTYRSSFQSQIKQIAPNEDTSWMDNQQAFLNFLITEQLPNWITSETIRSVDAEILFGVVPYCINEYFVGKPPVLLINKTVTDAPQIAATADQVERTRATPASEVVLNTVTVANRATKTGAVGQLSWMGWALDPAVTDEIVEQTTDPTTGETWTVIHEVTTVTVDGKTYDGFTGRLTVNGASWEWTFYIDGSGQLVANIPWVNNWLWYYQLANFPPLFTAQYIAKDAALLQSIAKYLAQQESVSTVIDYNALLPYGAPVQK